VVCSMVKSIKDFREGQVSVEQTPTVTSAVSGEMVRVAAVEESMEVVAAMCRYQSKCTRCSEYDKAAEQSSD